MLHFADVKTGNIAITFERRLSQMIITEELQILSLQNKKLKDDLNSNVAGEKDTVSNWRKSLELEKVTRLKVKVLYLNILW